MSSGPKSFRAFNGVPQTEIAAPMTMSTEPMARGGAMRDELFQLVQAAVKQVS